MLSNSLFRKKKRQKKEEVTWGHYKMVVDLGLILLGHLPLGDGATAW